MESKDIIGIFCLVLSSGALIFSIVVAIKVFINKPKEEQISVVKEWLKWAVSEAERIYGSGTGQLKLRYVYDMAIGQFPWIKTVVSFETFSDWVDTALLWLNDQLEKNNAIEKYVNKCQD